MKRILKTVAKTLVAIVLIGIMVTFLIGIVSILYSPVEVSFYIRYYQRYVMWLAIVPIIWFFWGEGTTSVRLGGYVLIANAFALGPWYRIDYPDIWWLVLFIALISDYIIHCITAVQAYILFKNWVDGKV